MKIIEYPLEQELSVKIDPHERSSQKRQNLVLIVIKQKPLVHKYNYSWFNVKES